MPWAKLDVSLIGKVSNNALIVYTMMRDRGTYDNYIHAWLLRYKIQTIAEMCNISTRCCRSCIQELEQVGLLTHDRTGRSSEYIIVMPGAQSQPGSKSESA